MYQYAPLNPNGEAWLNWEPTLYCCGLIFVNWFKAFCAPPAIDTPLPIL